MARGNLDHGRLVPERRHHFPRLIKGSARGTVENAVARCWLLDEDAALAVRLLKTFRNAASDVQSNTGRKPQRLVANL